MGVDEVMVAPGLEPRIKSRVVRGAECVQDAVKVPGVLGVRIGGREVGAPAEPLVQGPPFRVGDLEVSHVEMHRRDHRAARVDDHAHASHVEPCFRCAPDTGAESLSRRPRQRSLHHRSVYAGLFERRALGQDPGDATTAPLAIPAILPEFAASVERGEEPRRLVMQRLDQRGDPLPEALLAHVGRHSRTASTNARACATGTSGSMPCPRFAMWPCPPNASSISCVRWRMTDGGE